MNCDKYEINRCGGNDMLTEVRTVVYAYGVSDCEKLLKGKGPLRDPFFSVLIADFHTVLFIIGTSNFSFLW